MYVSMLTIAALSVLSAVSAQPATEEFIHLETLWNAAHRTGDADALDRLWASDLEVDVPGMAPMTKAQSLAFARTGRMRFERYETSQPKVRPYGDTAVVTGRLQRTRTICATAARRT